MIQPNDKRTNDTLLCMVSPAYALMMSASVPLTDFDIRNQTDRVMLHVIEWYKKNYTHGNHIDNSIRKPSNDEILDGIDDKLKQHAQQLIAFKDSDEGKKRLLSAVGLS